MAVLVVLGWLGVSALGGPTFGKLADVSSNDQATFLPATAESTLAGEWVSEFSESSQIPAIVVADFDEEFAEQDIGDFAPLAEDIGEVDGVDQVIGPIPSEDMLAVQYIALINTDDADIGDTVEAIRALVAPGGDPDHREGPFASTQLHVTGPAGLSADLASAFAGIDGLLLIVALSVVLVILVIVYRSVLLPLLVMLTSIAALCAAVLVVYYMAAADWIQLNGQSQGILAILVIGAATDYALLLVARHREELNGAESVWHAIKTAWKGSFGAITASASTVAIALLCLLVSDLNSNRSLGPIAATGIVFAWLAALTMLPALLYCFGRAAFWPAKPKPAASASTGVWSRIASAVEKRPRKVWVVTALLLMLGAAWLPTLKADGVAQSDVILGASDAKSGQAVLSDHFDAGSGSPTSVIVPEASADQALAILEDAEGVGSATLTAANGSPAGIPPANAEPKVQDGKVYIQATLEYVADSEEAETTVLELREELHALDDDILVGGTTATAIDSNATAQRDLVTIIPLVLVVVLLILIVLLRAVLLPVILVSATVLSFGTAMGTAALVFNHVFKFPGADPSVPLYGFVFLVALGIDYTIFLMTRAREETLQIGTRAGVLKSLAVTGGVITSAGVVLAATFAALAVIPLMFMIQLAFIVAFGVLIDTLIVRTLLIPGLVLHIGPAVWWPFTKRTEPAGLEEAERSAEEFAPDDAAPRRAL
ncbi:MAG: MMPL family transporter [Propionibacterium sp.]|nr:MMPL family transporter [Propionibacterium sp.]